MQPQRDWPAFMVLLSNVSASQLQPHTLPGMTIIMGPFNHVPATSRTVALDFGSTISPVFDLPAADLRVPGTPARLVLHKLLLRGLVAAPLPPTGELNSSGNGETDPGQSVSTSALPLWAIRQQGLSGEAQVYLSKCTVVLPRSDYAALLSAALRGDAWKSGARASARLMAGISVFRISAGAPLLTPESVALSVAEYAGWRVNGTSLTFISNEPMVPCAPLPDWEVVPLGPGCSSQGGSGHSSEALKIGLGVGLGVGLGLLLLLGGGAVWAWGGWVRSSTPALQPLCKEPRCVHLRFLRLCCSTSFHATCHRLNAPCYQTAGA